MTFSRMECLMLLGCTAVVFGQVKKTYASNLGGRSLR